MANEIDSRIQTDAKDFQGLVQAFFEFSQHNYSDVWNDFNRSQFMTLIAELIAYEGDLLTYFADKQTSENFLTTAQLRQSIIDIGKMLDYTLRSPEPSTGEITLTLDTGVFSYGTPIPAGFRVSNGDLVFETTVETNVTPASPTVTIPVIEGETFRQTVIGQGALGQSDGKPNQEFILERKNVILSNNLASVGSDISVLVDNVAFSPVFNIVTAQSTSKVYVISTDDANRTKLRFGNGVFGAIPALGATVEATYRALLNERENNSYGNVNANTVTTLVDTLPGITAVNNSIKFSGGRPAETIEEARANIPKSLKAGDRAVSNEDFETLANSIPGVAKAVALKGRSDLDVDLYLAPEGGGNPSQALKNSAVVFFESRKMIRTQVFPRDPIYQPVQLNLRVQAAANNRNIDIKNAIDSALLALFDFDNMAFGQGVFLKSTGGSDLFDINETIESVNGIDKIKYNKIALKPFIYNKKFTNTGTPTLLEECCSIRNNAERREREVVMKSTTEFLLKTKEFGFSTSLNDTRLEDNLKTFLLDSGATTSVSSGFLVDSSQFWITNQYQYQTLIDSAGTHFKILSNTNDTLAVSGTPAAGDYQIVRRLAGYYVTPNTNRTDTFLILDNDATSVSVAVGLSEVSVIGDPYEIYRYETNKFDSEAYEGTSTGVSSSTSFSDTTTIGDGDDVYNDMYVIFQEGPAANLPVKVTDFVSVTGTFTHQSLGVGIQPNVGDRYVVSPAFYLGKAVAVKSTPAPTTTVFSAVGIGAEGNDFYNNWVVKFTSGALSGQIRKVIDYDDSGADTLTTHSFANPPATGDIFQLAKEYQADDQSITFAVLSSNAGISDVYLFQTSGLVDDITPRENQILTLDPSDLTITVVGGS